MKKLLTIILSISVLGLFAQKGLHLGVMGGPFLSSQLNNQDFDYSEVRYNGITVGGGGGITLNYHFKDRIGLGTQFLIAQQGLKYKNRQDVEFMRKTTYFKLPILLHINSPSDKLVGGYFYIGPQFSFLVDKDFVRDGVSFKKEYGETSLFKKYSDYHNVFTFGAATGFGIVFNALDGRLLINTGLRLDADFLDAYKGKDLIGDPNITYNPLLPQGTGNYKYTYTDKETGLFAMDPATGERQTTFNVGGMVEVGIRYVFLKK